MEGYTKKELMKLINEPVEWQYQRIQAKMLEALNWTNGDILLCFSGGKDSALLLDMYCELVKMVGMGNTPIKVGWANTTNETTTMNKYVKWFIDRTQEKYGVNIAFEEVKPENNQTFVTVAKENGLPFVSKMVAATLRKVTKDMESKGITYDDVKNLHNPDIKSRDALREMGLNATTVLAFTGWSCNRNDFGTEFILAKRWMPLLDIKRATGKDIRFSEKCCTILKKDPIARLNYPNIMTGEQATESKSREAAWLKTGCNYRFADGSIRSKPLGSVSLDAILYAIKYRNIPICSDYGEIEEYMSCDKKCYRCTKAQRTGCALCGFGIARDPDRFVRLQESDPSKVAFAFKPIEKGGLGYKEVCEYSNEYCGTEIVIPNI